MIYEELLSALLNLPEERLQDDVAVYIQNEDETYEVTHGAIVKPRHPCHGILDNGHFVLHI